MMKKNVKVNCLFFFGECLTARHLLDCNAEVSLSAESLKTHLPELLFRNPPGCWRRIAMMFCPEWKMLKPKYVSWVFLNRHNDRPKQQEREVLEQGLQHYLSNSNVWAPPTTPIPKSTKSYRKKKSEETLAGESPRRYKKRTIPSKYSKCGEIRTGDHKQYYGNWYCLNMGESYE
jgi:hypothetical protein